MWWHLLTSDLCAYILKSTSTSKTKAPCCTRTHTQHLTRIFVLQIWGKFARSPRPSQDSNSLRRKTTIDSVLNVGDPGPPANHIVPQPILISEKCLLNYCDINDWQLLGRIYRRHAKGFIKILGALDLRVHPKWLATPSSIMHNDANRIGSANNLFDSQNHSSSIFKQQEKLTPHLAVQSTLDLGGLCETEPIWGTKGQNIRRDGWYFMVFLYPFDSFCFTSGCLQKHTESRSRYIDIRHPFFSCDCFQTFLGSKNGNLIQNSSTTPWIFQPDFWVPRLKSTKGFIQSGWNSILIPI